MAVSMMIPNCNKTYHYRSHYARCFTIITDKLWQLIVILHSIDTMFSVDREMREMCNVYIKNISL